MSFFCSVDIVCRLCSKLKRYAVILRNRFFFQKWKNPFLSWKPENYNGMKVINVDPKLVWKPDLVLYNKYVHVYQRLISNLTKFNQYLSYLTLLDQGQISQINHIFKHLDTSLKPLSLINAIRLNLACMFLTISTYS